MTTKAQLADKIERHLSGDRDTVFLKAGEWSMILEALRQRTHDMGSREYVLAGSASHGPR
jgi:hypothetical protein